jgi:hypothetical protein
MIFKHYCRFVGHEYLEIKALKYSATREKLRVLTKMHRNVRLSPALT